MAAFLGTGSQVLTATSSSVKAWSRTGAELSSRAKGKDEKVAAIAANGDQVLLAAPGGARVLDLKTSRELVLPIKAPIKAAAFDSAGRRVLIADARGAAVLWWLSGPRPKAIEVAANPDGAMGEQVAFSPDDRWLAAGFDNRSVQVCRVLSTRLQCHRLEVARPDAMADRDRSIRYRRMRLAFSPDSARLYALIHPLAKAPVEPQSSKVQELTDLEPGESGLGAWVLEGSQGPQLLSMMGMRRQPTHMALSASGDRMVLAGQGPTVQVLDLTMPVWEVSDVVVFQPDQKLLRMFANPSLGKLAFLASDGQITSWDPEPRYPHRVLVDPNGPFIDAFSFDADGQGCWRRSKFDPPLPIEL